MTKQIDLPDFAELPAWYGVTDEQSFNQFVEFAWLSLTIGISQAIADKPDGHNQKKYRKDWDELYQVGLQLWLQRVYMQRRGFPTVYDNRFANMMDDKFNKDMQQAGPNILIDDWVKISTLKNILRKTISGRERFVLKCRIEKGV